MGFRFADLERVGPEAAEKLAQAGITNTDELCASQADAAALAALAARTGIELDKLREWSAMSDLCRIRGINEGLSQLLEALGIDSVRKLAACDAAILVKQMRRKNVEIYAVRGVGPESIMARWIEDAKALTGAV
jgi:predicted flap endonuclease-1-like 5' DNA nuclease